MKKLLLILIAVLVGVCSAPAQFPVYEDYYGDVFGTYNDMGGSYLVKSDFKHDGLNYAIVGMAPAQAAVMAPNAEIRIIECEPMDCPPYFPSYRADYESLPGWDASGELEIPSFFRNANSASENDGISICTVTRIMTGAFANCTELTGIKLPNYLCEIRPGAFYNCSKLEHIYSNAYGRAVTIIYPWAFRGCSALRKADMSFVYRVNICGGEVFKDCPNLEEIVLRAEGEEFRMMTGRTVPSLKTIRLITNVPNSMYGSRIFPEPFLEEEYANAKLIVPDGSKELYQAIEPWSNFQHICTESEYSSAESVVVGHEVVNVEGRSASLIDLDSDAEIYEISGRLAATLTAETPEFTAPFPGIYIIRSGSNSQKVVLQ